MSWDRIDYTELSECACGKGVVERRTYRRDDDWGRSETTVISEEILCDSCKDTHHIEHYVRHYFCHRWDGDGISDKAYLVPNGISIPAHKSKRAFSFREDEKIVAEYPLEEILRAKGDMIQSRYSTRLTRASSKKIVEAYFKKHKKKSLPPIIQILTAIEEDYSSYQWTPEKIASFRLREQAEIDANNDSIQNVLARSFELKFRGASDE